MMNYSKQQKIIIIAITRKIIKAFLLFSLKNCLNYPTLVASCLKLLIDGIRTFKNFISKPRSLIFNLILIYFHYNVDKLEISKIKNNQSFIEFNLLNEKKKTKMKNILIK